jgi:aryl-alcohol dehydrogenase-like predicted oxidoreductase
VAAVYHNQSLEKNICYYLREDIGSVYTAVFKGVQSRRQAVVKKHLPFVLGGHSFIQQLGNEPKPTETEQIEIVETCLDNGVSWFDTTYLPERVALGRALNALGRRNEASIIAWNFFTDFDDEEPHGKAAPFRTRHIQQMQDELQTDFIDCLVIHSVDDPHEDLAQEELAREWLDAGHVRRLGTWRPDPEDKGKFSDDGSYSFMVSPFNITTPAARPGFAMGKELGWETLACSPFVRGYVLDEMVQHAMGKQTRGDSESSTRSRIADLMLRFSLYQDTVDRLIVSMRRTEWVHKNIDSFRKGELSEDESRYLKDLIATRSEE